MHTKRLTCLSILAVLALCSCAKGPAPPKPGSPEFYWGAAKETWRTGDNLKTCDNLLQVTKSDNEFTAQAQPWLVVVAGGLTQGYSTIADRFESGTRAAKDAKPSFRKTVSAARTSASMYALTFTEAFHKMMDANKNDKLPLAFSFPVGSATEPPQLGKVAKGMLLPAAEQDLLERAILQRGVLLTACRAVGAPGDSAKALALFQSTDPVAPRGTFLIEMAKLANEQSDLFSPKKLDQPNRVQMMLKEAMEAVDAVPGNKDGKVLGGKIQATLKKIRKT